MVSPPRSVQLPRRLAGLLVCTSLVACDQPVGTPAPDVSAFVTGNAAENLDPRGNFVFPTAADGRGGHRISPRRAAELAESFVRTYGPGWLRAWEGQRGRGRPIRLSRLEADPRVLPAESSFDYQSIAPEFHPAHRRFYGPHFLVLLRDGSEPVLVVKVSMHNTGGRIDARGRYIPPQLSGGDIAVYPIPIDSAGSRWLGPEQAVEGVGKLTGARVTEVPERRNPGRDLLPTEWPWKLVLDRPVRVRTVRGRELGDVREIYVGEGGAFLVPHPDQPVADHTTGALPGPKGDWTDAGAFSVPILAGSVTRFEEAVLVASGGGGR